MFVKVASTAQCGWCFFAYIIKIINVYYVLITIYNCLEIKPIIVICIIDILKTYWYSRLYDFYNEVF